MPRSRSRRSTSAKRLAAWPRSTLVTSSMIRTAPGASCVSASARATATKACWSIGSACTLASSGIARPSWSSSSLTRAVSRPAESIRAPLTPQTFSRTVASAKRLRFWCTAPMTKPSVAAMIWPRSGS